MDDIDLAVATGDIDASQYAALVGPSYTQNQSAYDGSDNGTIQTSGTPVYAGVGSINPAAATNPPPAGGTSYTPPAWQTFTQGLSSLVGSATGAANQLSPLINGTPAPAAQTAAAAAAANTTLYLALGAGALVLFLLLKK